MSICPSTIRKILELHLKNSLQITSTKGHSKPSHPVICQSKRFFLGHLSIKFQVLLLPSSGFHRAIVGRFCFLLSDSDTLEKTAASGTQCASAVSWRLAALSECFSHVVSPGAPSLFCHPVRAYVQNY